MADIADTLKNTGEAIKRGAQTFTGAAEAVASPVLKAIGVQDEGPKLPRQPGPGGIIYNRSGEAPTVTVNDDVTKKPF